MAVVDDVIGSVAVVAVFIAAALLVFSSVQKTTQHELRMWQQYDIEENMGNTLDSALMTTESRTNRTYGELLGAAAYYRRDTLPYNNDTMDIAANFRDLLGSLTRYSSFHFSVSPGVSAVTLHFIIDGSDSVTDEMQDIASGIGSFEASANSTFGARSVDTRVHILDFSNSTKCTSFPSVPCEYMTYGDFYFNRTYTVMDTLQHDYGLVKPDYIEDENEVWKSDWETASMAVLLGIPMNLSHLHILFPVTDALPTSTHIFHPCPEDYAASILERDTSILAEHFAVLNPVYSQNLDPIRFCDEYAMQHIESLVADTPGTLVSASGNIERKVNEAFGANAQAMTLEGGEMQDGYTYAVERQVPMPNGDLATITLRVKG